MNNRICVAVILFLSAGWLQAQQLDSRSPFGSFDFIYNPAFTANYQVLDFGGFYKNQWAGLEGAPKTASLYGQVAFRNDRMSIGGFYTNDRTGGFENNAFGLSYRYGFSPNISTQNDLLSVGLMLGYNARNYRTGRDLKGDITDAILFIDRNQFGESWGALGFSYVSDRRIYNQYKSGFIIGASVRSVPIVTTARLGEDIVWDSEIHFNGSISYRQNSSNAFFQPSLWSDFTVNGAYLLNFDALYEMTDTFWSSINLRSDATIGLQVGSILGGNAFGDGNLRIGVHGNYNIASAGQDRGFSWQALVSYRFFTE